MYKLINLLCTTKSKEMNRLAIYLIKAQRVRSLILHEYLSIFKASHDMEMCFGLTLNSGSEGPGQTVLMRRLIWTFADALCPKTCPSAILLDIASGLKFILCRNFMFTMYSLVCSIFVCHNYDRVSLRECAGTGACV